MCNRESNKKKIKKKNQKAKPKFYMFLCMNILSMTFFFLKLFSHKTAINCDHIGVGLVYNNDCLCTKKKSGKLGKGLFPSLNDIITDPNLCYKFPLITTNT